MLDVQITGIDHARFRLLVYALQLLFTIVYSLASSISLPTLLHTFPSLTCKNMLDDHFYLSLQSY